MCELCDKSDDGSMESCQDCGRLICWDVETGDDTIRPAYAAASADLYCDRCGSAHDRAEEGAMAEEWDGSYADDYDCGDED